MIQCFVKREYEAPFGLTQMPRLFSVSRTDEKASAHPRVALHAHDDLRKSCSCERRAAILSAAPYKSTPRRSVHLQQPRRARYFVNHRIVR